MAAIVSGSGMDQFIRANLGYRARPLDGVWATPPYLHNSSVPNLYQMLVPAARRARRFSLGSTRFDPKHVGFETDPVPGAFEMDTTQTGNLNTGHEFRNLTLEELEARQGIVGDRQISPRARWAAVLGIDPQQFGTMTAHQQWELTREVTRRSLGNPDRPGVKGVLGSEFTEDERWQLVEYLKSL
jgi:hypothetical protein